MVGKVAIRGFLAVLALALVGACSSAPRPSARVFEPATAVVCDPCGDPCDPCEHICPPEDTTWPCACGSPTAMGMLNQIKYLAQSAQSEWIDPAALEIIEAQVVRCLEPGLIPEDQLPIMEPDPCAWVRQLYDEAHAAPAPYPPLKTAEVLTPEQMDARVKAGSRHRWETIATDLENFPAGPIKSPR